MVWLSMCNDVKVAHGRQDPQHMCEMREVVKTEGERYEGHIEPVENSVAWAGVWQGPHWVVFGHDAARQVQVSPSPAATYRASEHLTTRSCPTAGTPVCTGH